jgi:meso-butanediol dehydrogenase / (S,S)-butanediol dehydrogenase / diacetyl reductase
MGDGRFAGKVVVVTGAASGIGTAIADRLLAQDATVVALDVSVEGLDRLVTARPGARLRARAVDLADPAAVATVIDEVAAAGGIDAVVPDAGVATAGRAGDLSDDDWQTLLAVRVDAVLGLVRAALPHLIASGGAVVSTASIAGLGGGRGMATYSAAKGALISVTRSLAMDHGRDGVRINAVTPGFVATPASLRSRDVRLEIDQDDRDRTPVGWIGRPEEIAAAVAFLASGDASGITGTTLTVDGGLTARAEWPSPG